MIPPSRVCGFSCSASLLFDLLASGKTRDSPLLYGRPPLLCWTPRQKRRVANVGGIHAGSHCRAAGCGPGSKSGTVVIFGRASVGAATPRHDQENDSEKH